MIQTPDHDQVFPPREIFINVGVLSGEPDQFANLVRILHDIETFYMGLAFILREESCKYAYERRFSRSVGPQKPQNSAFFDGEIDTSKRLYIIKGLFDSGDCNARRPHRGQQYNSQRSLSICWRSAIFRRVQ